MKTQIRKIKGLLKATDLKCSTTYWEPLEGTGGWLTCLESRWPLHPSKPFLSPQQLQPAQGCSNISHNFSQHLWSQGKMNPTTPLTDSCSWLLSTDGGEMYKLERNLDIFPNHFNANQPLGMLHAGHYGVSHLSIVQLSATSKPEQGSFRSASSCSFSLKAATARCACKENAKWWCVRQCKMLANEWNKSQIQSW